MTPDVARFAMAFMNRVELKGAEVQTWVAVFTALQDIAEPMVVEEGKNETESETRPHNGAA